MNSIEILTRAVESQNGSWLRDQGCSWVSSVFLPALKDLERSQRTKEETFLLADGYYCLGDVHHFNGVPRAAAKAYRRSARFDPSQGAAFRELGGMLASTGQRAGALAAHKVPPALFCNTATPHKVGGTL